MGWNEECCFQNTNKNTKYCASFLVVGETRCSNLLFILEYVYMVYITRLLKIWMRSRAFEFWVDLFPILWCTYALSSQSGCYFQLSWSNHHNLLNTVDEGDIISKRLTMKIPSNQVMTQGWRINIVLRYNCKDILLGLTTKSKLLLVVLLGRY